MSSIVERCAGAEKAVSDIRQSYEYKEETLRHFVEERSSSTAEQERATAREERKLEVELKRKAEVREELQEEGGDDKGKEEGAESTGSRRPQRLPIPCYVENQDIRRYLEVLESVLKKNGYKKEYWLLALSTSVLGTSEEGTLEDSDTYDKAKEELLVEFGQSQEACWRALLTSRPGPEAFHRYSSRVLKDMASIERSGGVDCGTLTNSKCALLVVKQLAMAGVSDGMKAFIKARKVNAMLWDDFQTAGASRQEDHGRDTGRRQTAPQAPRDSAPLWSGQCLSLEVEDVVERLKSLSAEEREQYVRDRRLCFNCLQPGHVCQCCILLRCGSCSHLLDWSDGRSGSNAG